MEIDTHMHSNHSNDSRSKVESIIERAVGLGLGAIAVTDHNSWEGAREAQRLAKGRILIIPGAEIKTDKGDVVALFVSEEIAARQYAVVIDEIRSKGGVSIVPHPGDSPKLTTEDLRLADGLEAFNSTCTPKSNERARLMVAELGKPAFAVSDAHMVMEVGNGRTRVPYCTTLEELRKIILSNPVQSRTESSNLLMHRINSVLNFGIKGIWSR